MILRIIPAGAVEIAICVNHPNQRPSAPIITLHIDSDDIFSVQTDGSLKKTLYALACNGMLCHSCIFRSADHSRKEKVIKYVANDLKELADIYPEYFI